MAWLARASLMVTMRNGEQTQAVYFAIILGYVARNSTGIIDCGQCDIAHAQLSYLRSMLAGPQQPAACNRKGCQ
jgi:hypothetical protein